MASYELQTRLSWTAMREGNLDIPEGNLDKPFYPNSPRLPQFRSSVLACLGVQIGALTLFKFGSELDSDAIHSFADFEQPSDKN